MKQRQQVDGERLRRQFGRRREIAPGKLSGPSLGGLVEPGGDFADQLILEQSPDQLVPRIFPALFFRPARQQGLRLEPEEAACHLQVVGSLIQSEIVDHTQELIRDASYRDVRNVNLFFAEEVQQQI